MALEVKDCAIGPMMYDPTDAFIGHALHQYGHFAANELAVIGSIIQPDSVMIDVGANIGTHTVAYAKMVPSGSVLSFEPQSRLFHMLCGNIALNELTNVTPLRQAVGRFDNAITMIGEATPNNAGSAHMESDSGEIAEVVTLDSLDLSRCDFIKIDVEGFERDVLIGGENFINKHRPVLWVENDRTERSADLIAELLRLKYRAWWHFAPLVTNATEDDSEFGQYLSIDMLCVPQEDDADLTGFEPVYRNDVWDSAYQRFLASPHNKGGV